MKSTLLFLNKLMLLANDHTTFSNSFNPTLLEKCLKAPVAGALWYQFKKPVPKASKIHEKYSLWLGFELATSSLARCSFTISATQFF